MTGAAFTAAMALMLKYNCLRLTHTQLAAELGYAPSTLYNLIAAGRCPVPTYLEGGKRYVDVRDLGAYIDSKREAAMKEFQEAA